MDYKEKLQSLADAAEAAEASYGPESIELAIALEKFAEFLRENKLRALDAANMKARADVIRSKHQPVQQANTNTATAVQKPAAALQKVVVRKYVGNEAEAASKFQYDATQMAAHNYFPTAQVWAPGSYGCGMFLLALLLCWILVGILIFIYMLVVKPAGTLTVTYELREPAPIPVTEPINEKTCPRCAEQVKAAAKICRFCNYSFETEAG